MPVSQERSCPVAVSAPPRGSIRPEHLPPPLRPNDRDGSAATTLADARQSFERQFVRGALLRAGGRPSLAARELGISRQGLAKLMKRLDLSRPA